MNILSQCPTANNHFTARQQRMESALAGYRLQIPTNDQTRSYLDGLLIRGMKFICGKPSDRFCRITITVAFFYVYGYLLWQAIHYWLVMR